MIPEKLVELNPREWTSSDQRLAPPPSLPAPRRADRLIGMACALLAFALSFYLRVLWTAPAADHSVVPPGAYAWTPEHGLQPLTSGSLAAPPRR